MARSSSFPALALLAWAALLSACSTTRIEVAEEGGFEPHPLLTACDGVRFRMTLRQDANRSELEGTALGGRIIFEDHPGLEGFNLRQHVEVEMVVVSLPQGPVARECPFVAGELRRGGPLVFRRLPQGGYGIDLEELKSPSG